MEDPDTGNPEIEPPQKARTPLPSSDRFNLNSSSIQVPPAMVLAPILNKSIFNLPSFSSSILGGWTTIKIELCTAVSTILERSQLVPSLKSSRSKFIELGPKSCLKR
ncbi:hypothetical protein BPAE_0107g00090 [Botrytis paeoniae]|uniref:Uncharacterized protein n=1 Tax=Botrytis paeoniae TaxID=278948 RepID=A0A4Z1FN98_9HELO|nr:hypothetical protein BPAE_0107g00090 [Botrytis paeoniae]